MNKLLVLCLFSLSLISANSHKDKFGFNVTAMPKGANVTLPQPATLKLNLTERVTLESTDLPQTLKFKSIHPQGKKFTDVLELAIFDRNQDRVRYVKLSPKMPFLYSFHALGPISIVPKLARKRGNQNVFVVVESDKPLQISR